MKKNNIKKQSIVVICGVKNSGKTTLITKLIPKFTSLGYKVATIKHDGHDFDADVEGTDSYKHKQAGAYGTAVFSKNKFMVVKEQKETDEFELINLFPEADLIYPKIEIVRKGNSYESVCNKENLIAIASDIDIENNIKNLNIDKKIIDLNNIDKIVEKIIQYIEVK